ncbi:hypothetical protein [Sinorhizobium fredii]|uniref:Uncharacterized protein n=1 Tax=Rhizobium fredii TaxID=380 RepID=A0A2L0H491_RHIFR|nr:hypothetical protein [Sinorhizobium fredii]AUX76283.1 hypothetical protein NXT3_CH01710 [Sinorhizobium fredii]
MTSSALQIFPPMTTECVLDEALARECASECEHADVFLLWMLARGSTFSDEVKLLTAMSDLPNEAYLMLAMSRARMGNPIAPGDIMTELRSKDPEWTPAHLDRMPFVKAEDQEHWMKGLEMIGIPKTTK